MPKRQAYQLICTMPSGAAWQINASRVLGCAIRRTRATQALKYDSLRAIHINVVAVNHAFSHHRSAKDLHAYFTAPRRRTHCSRLLRFKRTRTCMLAAQHHHHVPIAHRRRRILTSPYLMDGGKYIQTWLADLLWMITSVPCVRSLIPVLLELYTPLIVWTATEHLSQYLSHRCKFIDYDVGLFLVVVSSQFLKHQI